MELRIATCKCGQRIQVPIKADYSDPYFVLAVEQRNRSLIHALTELRTELHELAQECLDAGVKPSILKRADDALALLAVLKVRYDFKGDK